MKHLILPIENKTNMTIDEIFDMNDTLSKQDNTEIWKPIRFDSWDPSIYSVSSTGRVRNDSRNKILTPYLDTRCGYHYVTLYTHSDDDNKRKFAIHDLVASAFCPWRSENNAEHVHHIRPDEKTNNNYWNLIFLSVLEHVMIHDSLNYYNPRKGDDHPMAIYSNEQIENLCMLLEENKLSNKELECITGVKINDIGYIRYGRNWRHISSKYNIPKLRDANRTIAFYDSSKLDTVCELILKGLSNKEISDITGIKHDTISNIRHGKSHKDLCKKYGII